jgi:hypothetical protein
VATKTKRLVELPDEQLQELFGLVKGSDSVELKLTVPATDHRKTVAALGMDPLDAQIRQVFFFDTPDLTLNQAGVVVRARRVQGKTGDTVVKLRPVVPDQLPAELRKSPSFNVEVDAMPGGYVCSGSLKGKADNAVVRETAAGKRPIRKLYTKEQRSFFAAHAPEGLELDSLSALGPIFVLKLKYSPEDAPSPLVAEMWLYPDGSRILELSTKCAPSEMLQAAMDSRMYLSGKGVDLEGEQQTKTKTALEFFSSELS